MANITVNLPNDDGKGLDTDGLASTLTLSEAIFKANTDPGPDTIVLATDVAVSGVMTRLLNSDITITSDNPAAPRTIDGTDKFRPLFVKSGTIRLKNLTLTKGLAKGGNSGEQGGQELAWAVHCSSTTGR